MSPYQKELAALSSGRVAGGLLRGMTGLELAKLCESARAVCESSDEAPSFHAWCETKGLPHATAVALIEKFEAGGFDGQG